MFWKKIFGKIWIFGAFVRGLHFLLPYFISVFIFSMKYSFTWPIFSYLISNKWYIFISKWFHFFLPLYKYTICSSNFLFSGVSVLVFIWWCSSESALSSFLISFHQGLNLSIFSVPIYSIWIKAI